MLFDVLCDVMVYAIRSNESLLPRLRRSLIWKIYTWYKYKIRIRLVPAYTNRSLSSVARVLSPPILVQTVQLVSPPVLNRLIYKFITLSSIYIYHSYLVLIFCYLLFTLVINLCFVLKIYVYYLFIFKFYLFSF